MTRGGVLKAHIQTWRPYTMWYVGLLGLAGAGLAGGRHDGTRLVIAWAAPTVGWIGAHYLGDYFDRELDAISKPHRPIPSGRLSPRAAVAFGVGCVVLLGILSVPAGWRAGVVALGAVGGMVAYSRGLKARGLSGNLIRGVLGAFALVYGAFVMSSPPGWVLVPFVVAFWAHDTSSNLVGTLRDIDGDRAGGYQTLPVRHGNRVGVWVSVLFYVVAVIAAGVGGLIRSGGVGYVALLIFAVAIGAPAYGTLVARRADLPVRTALRAHELLVLERLVLAGAGVALGLGTRTAIVLLVPMIVFTGWTQARMRAGYELGPTAGHGRGVDSPTTFAVDASR